MRDPFYTHPVKVLVTTRTGEIVEYSSHITQKSADQMVKDMSKFTGIHEALNVDWSSTKVFTMDIRKQ